MKKVSEAAQMEQYVINLEQLLDEFLFNKIRLTQNSKSGLADFQKDKLNEYTKRIGSLQMKLVELENKDKQIEQLG